VDRRANPARIGPKARPQPFHPPARPQMPPVWPPNPRRLPCYASTPPKNLPLFEVSGSCPAYSVAKCPDNMMR
jgi:hypothetical protein